jgi:exopolysaccharide production protein ExoQ
MNASVASLVCACSIAVLLYLDREKSPRSSTALWLPGIWIAIDGSRPLSVWLGMSPPTNMRLDGSPFDAAVFGLLLAVAIVVLISRKNRTQVLLRSSWPILIYFLFCLISVVWSSHPDVSLKRWIKAVGDLAMVLVIATDLHPIAALRRLVSRVGFLLFPTSVLFIKYFGDLGRGYTSDGLPMNTGVTTNKNTLGVVVLVISLVVLSNVRSLLVQKDQYRRRRRLVAQGVLLACGITLLLMAQSSTCKACFALGSFLIIVSNFRLIRRQPARLHALCLATLLIAGFALFFGQAGVANALGRESNMSGRTDIWDAVLPAVPNAVVGAGFESFWISPNVKIFQQTLLSQGWYPPLVEDLNEAHDGYIEVYLNLGWIGLCLIAGVLIGGYRRSVKAFQRDPELGGLFLAYVVVAVFYNITEAGFRMLSPSWIFLLLAIVSASAVSALAIQRDKATIRNRRNTIGDTAYSGDDFANSKRSLAGC